MSRRIEIELTSARDDGSWTWRAAGAKQPRGTVDAGLVPGSAKVGDVLRAEADFEIDGILVTSVLGSPQRARTEPERIEIVGSGSADDQLVTTSLIAKGRSDRRDGDRDRRPRRDGDRADRGPRRDGERTDRPPRTGDRPSGDRADRGARGSAAPGEARDRPPRPEGDRDRRPRRPAPPPMPERPKPKRLRAGRIHRKAVLDELKPELRPIAEQVLRGGIPAVRQAIEIENEKKAAAGEPHINAPELLGLAEQLLPRLKSAEWHDRADAAIADGAELDLRDLRSVVVAADVGARDDETRALASQLRTLLDERVESEQHQWLDDLALALETGRVVRALRMSSRPPKAGTILAPDLRAKLTAAAAGALTADVGADRWAAVLDALAFAPVRNDVEPASKPEQPGEDLLAAVRKFASRAPKVAAAFGVDAPGPAPRGPRPQRKGPLKPPPPPPRRAVAPVVDVEPTAEPTPEVEPTPTPVAEPEPVAEVEPTPEPVAETEPEPVAELPTE